VEPVNEIAAALAAAQAEMQNPPLDGVNPHFKSKYATLAGVRNAVVPVLAKHGIAITQALVTRMSTVKERDEAGTDVEVPIIIVGVITELLHTSGQRLTFPVFEAVAGTNNVQGVASISTYLRRYAMLSIAAVVGEDDDDGNEASRPKAAYKAPGSPQPRQAAQPAPVAHPATKAPTEAYKNWRGKTRSEWGTLTNDAQTAQGDISTAQVRELLKLGEALKKSPPMLAREIQTNFAEGLLAAGCPTVLEVWQIDAPTADEALAWYRKAAEQAKGAVTS